MAIPGKNADLIRRFKFYGFGFLLGILVVSVVYKGKGCQMPGSMKMEELNYQKLILTDKDKCILQCIQRSEADLKSILKSGKVNYTESDVHAKPYPYYVIEGKDLKGMALKFTVEDRDTVTQFKSISGFPAPSVPCNCN
jgi:hypothetical protein